MAAYKEYPSGDRLCSDCGMSKPQSEFNYRYPQLGIIYLKGICGSCEVARSKKWRECHREAYKAYQRAYKSKRAAHDQ